MLARTLAAALLIATLIPASSRAIPPDNWVLMVITAGSTGAEGIEAGALIRGDLIGTGTVPTAEGEVWGGEHHRFSLISLGGGFHQVQTPAGSINTGLTPNPPPSEVLTSVYTGTNGLVLNLAPGRSQLIGKFLVGYRIEVFPQPVKVTRGSVTVNFYTGSGAVILPANAPMSGSFVAAGPVTAGSFSLSPTTTAIAGGFSVRCIGACATESVAPDGYRATGLDVRATGVATSTCTNVFGGPGGKWTFSATGNMMSYGGMIGYEGPPAPVYLGFMPVGPQWPLFREIC